jgi:hypothetical protein
MAMNGIPNLSRSVELWSSLFPNEIAGKTENWDQNDHEVEDTIAPKSRDDAFIFSRKPNSRSNDSVERQKQHRENK